MVKKALLVGSVLVALMVAGCTTDPANVEQTGDGGVDSQGGAGSSSGSSNSSISGGMSEMKFEDGKLYSVYFNFDKFVVEGDANINTIKHNAKGITASTSEVRVEGNTDEWGSDEYNYALALKRAASVKDALISNGVSESKIKLVSYGESKPKCLEKTRACWRENRRVDFVLVSQ